MNALVFLYAKFLGKKVGNLDFQHSTELAGHPPMLPEGLPFKLTDHLDLVEWSGRMIREDKRGVIAASTPPLLKRLQIDPDNWKTLTTQFERSFKTFVVEPKTLANTTLSLGYQRSPGLSACWALLQ